MEGQRRCCLCSFLILLLLHIAMPCASSSLLAPNMSSCNSPLNLPVGEQLFSCCAPLANYSPPLFRPHSSSSPPPALRVRRPAHLADTAYAEKLARAYTLMKALPPDDPRSFMQQANIHCAFCNSVYNIINSSQRFEVHKSWLFFPFHRWYIYFHERILGKLLGEEDFAIPFWNYDHPDGSTIPWLYSSYNLTLTDALRESPRDDPPAIVAIDYHWLFDETRSHEVQLHKNENAMFFALMRASSKEAFLGQPYRPGDTPHSHGGGSVELYPHASVHNWVGQMSQIGWKDMGSFYAAARDPIFYAHHASIDRLWEVWKKMPNHYDYQDSDYLDAELAFYNEDAKLVRVKVGDATDAEKLGYIYEEVENLWMKATLERRSAGPAVLTAEDRRCKEREPILEACSFVAERNVEMIEKGMGEYMEFNYEYVPSKSSLTNIYVNFPGADAQTGAGCEEYFAYLAVLPHLEDTSVDVSRQVFKSDISEKLAFLNLSNEKSVVVTMVPNALTAPFTIFNFSFHYPSTPSSSLFSSL